MTRLSNVYIEMQAILERLNVKIAHYDKVTQAIENLQREDKVFKRRIHRYERCIVK